MADFDPATYTRESQDFDPATYTRASSDEAEFNPATYTASKDIGPIPGAVPEVRNDVLVRAPEPEDNRSILQKADDAFMYAKGAAKGFVGGAVGFIPSIIADMAGASPQTQQRIQEALTGKMTGKEEEGAYDTMHALSWLPAYGGIHTPVLARPKGKFAPKPAPRPISEVLGKAEEPNKVAETVPLKEDIPPPQLPELTPELDFWRERALQLQKEAQAKEAPPEVIRAEMSRPETEQQGVTAGTPEQMEGLRASTEGITYENLPPDAVVPRSAPTKGLETPRKGVWTVDENGIPVRSEFAPEHVLEPYEGHALDEGARNDLGVALQFEANGPKLGVGDHWGSEPLNKGEAGWGKSPESNLDLGLPKIEESLLNEPLPKPEPVNPPGVGIVQVRQSLVKGMAEGRIPAASGNLALWVLDRNPNLGNRLRLTSTTKQGPGLGLHHLVDDINHIVELFKGNDALTATHEILHRGEKMLPRDIQQGIRAEWKKQLNAALKSATGATKAALLDIKAALTATDKNTRAVHVERLLNALQKGKVSKADIYHLTNASEFWAVNGARLMREKHLSQSSWKYKAKQWFKEFTEKIKEVAGLPSDAPVYRGLKAILDPDVAVGDRKGARQLKDGVRPSADIPGITKGLEQLRARFGKQVSPPQTLQEIQARQQQRAKAQVASNVLETKLPEHYDPKSPEEAAAMAVNAKDIGPSTVKHSATPGLNFRASLSNNPLLKFARHLILGRAREAEVSFNNAFIDGEHGTTKAINKLDTADRLRLNELLTHLDKNNMEYTPEIGDRVGLSPNAKNFMEAWNRAAEAEWQWNSQIHGEQGVQQAPMRRGYVPAMDDGSYVSIVTVGDKIVGKVSATTPGDFFKGKRYYEEKYPGAKFSAETPKDARIPLSGGEQSIWKLRDISAFINLLTKEDNSYSAVQQAANKAALQEAINLGNFNYHNMPKKGIEGHMGDRPWLSPERNATDRIDSMQRFLRESSRYHSMQIPMTELRATMNLPEFAHMSNARNLLNDYLQNAQGQYIHDGGKISNAIFNAASKLPEAIPGLRKVWGVKTLPKIGNATKNTLSSMYMAWFNTAFMLTQLAQPIQMGIPRGLAVTRSLGLPDTALAKAFGKGYADAIRIDLHDGGILKSKDPELIELHRYIKDRGISDFTESERAYTGELGRVRRGVENVGNMSMKVGEHGGRLPMFTTYYRLLREGGVDKHNSMQVAEQMTNHTMGDYHQGERSLMYSGMGVMAPQTGALTTFKHTYLANQAMLAKAMTDKGQAAPIIASAMMAVALAGMTGLPGYDELDSVYQGLRGLLTDEKRSIRQDMMAGLPEWVKTGFASQAVGLNVQGKFETSQLAAGGDLFKTLAPYASGAWDIGRDVGKAIMDPSKQNLANAAVTLSPSTTRQLVKSQVQRDAQGNLLNRKGEVDVPRTRDEWRQAALWGLTPINEAVQRESEFQNRKNFAYQTERLKDIASKFRLAVIANDNDRMNQLLKDYEKAGGFPPALIKQIPNMHMEANKTSQERAEGAPKSMGGIRRWEQMQTPP